jgi:hypothetical protein
VRALKAGGRLVVCGGTSGPKVEVNLPRLFFKQIEIIGSTMGSYEEFASLTNLVAKGLPIQVDGVFDLIDYPKALERPIGRTARQDCYATDPMSDATRFACLPVDRLLHLLLDVSHRIHAHPELGFASCTHDLLTGVLAGAIDTTVQARPRYFPFRPGRATRPNAGSVARRPIGPPAVCASSPPPGAPASPWPKRRRRRREGGRAVAAGRRAERARCHAAAGRFEGTICADGASRRCDLISMDTWRYSG